MEVTYTTSLQDYLAYNLHQIRKGKALRRSYLMGWFLLPTLCLVASALLIASSSTGLEGGVFYACGLLTFTGVYLAAYPFLYRRCLVTRITGLAEDLGTQGIIGSITLVLGEETLTEITSVTRTEARWSSIHSVEEVGNYTFIMVTPMTAAILPRRAFPSDEVYNQVKEFALARIG